MTPEKSYFDDSAPQNEDGTRDYAYRGTLYDYSDGVGGGLIVRSYDDTPEEASFLARYDCAGAEKIRRSIAAIPYDEEFFRSVSRHLVSHEGKKKLKALAGSTGRYEAVDLAKIRNA